MSTDPNVAAVEGLEPAAVWRFFAGMASVPRPSNKEERIRAHMRDLAEQHGFTAREDRVGNMVIEVPASPGCENAPTIVLQGHLDMVCEKNEATQHDFDNDPIKLIVDKDADGKQIVRADGTTLGADNAIGVAMGLAAATSPDVKHGPLELLCTINEEQGMTGAKSLEPDFIKGRQMLNLDSEDDTVIYIGCAGGADATLTWELPTQPLPAGVDVVRVTVRGLKGGHSGGDIHLNRGNAIKVVTQVLRAAPGGEFYLADFKGGSLRNALAREAWCVVAGPAGLAKVLGEAAHAVKEEVRREAGEADIEITVEPVSGVEAALSAADSCKVGLALCALPHGPLAVVPEIPGLIQTSNNVATVRVEAQAGKLKITTGCLTRSSSKAQLHGALRRITSIGKLAEAEVVTGNEYPGWQPNLDSPTLASCRAVYQRLFGEEPNVTAIHAGLECGLIGERLGGTMDMASFGPHISGAHSPDECTYPESVQKSYRYLTAVLEELTKA
jgi:dipeptidase D